MAKRIAACACGALEVVVEAEPLKVSVCHCAACKRRTGSAFGVAVFFQRERMEISGRFGVFERLGESGEKVAFHFCPTCASTVFWYPAIRPDRVAIALGAFGDRFDLSPDQAVHCTQQVPWLTIRLP